MHSLLRDMELLNLKSSFNIENLVLGARSEFNGFAGTSGDLFWSTGVLEYWSVGKSEGQNFNLNWFFHYSITPPLHHSSRLPQGGKTIKAPRGAAQSRVLWVRILYFFVLTEYYIL